VFGNGGAKLVAGVGLEMRESAPTPARRGRCGRGCTEVRWVIRDDVEADAAPCMPIPPLEPTSSCPPVRVIFTLREIIGESRHRRVPENWTIAARAG
jgi:hypothetical protein